MELNLNLQEEQHGEHCWQEIQRELALLEDGMRVNTLNTLLGRMKTCFEEERNTLQRERKAWNEMADKLKRSQLPDCIRLCVGGKSFATSLSTLTSIKGTFLDSMFGGERHTRRVTRLSFEDSRLHVDAHRLTDTRSLRIAAFSQNEAGPCHFRCLSLLTCPLFPFPLGAFPISLASLIRSLASRTAARRVLLH